VALASDDHRGDSSGDIRRDLERHSLFGAGALNERADLVALLGRHRALP
jgi:hypothetical protein